MTLMLAAGAEVLRLTQYAYGAGCGRKIPPAELATLLRAVPPGSSRGVQCGVGEDAAAITLPGGGCVLSTADFANPIVDDPYDWGRIAAANALSDIYAMGGTPLTAVNLLSWPRDALPMELAAEVLRGGGAVCELAGCPVTGGHTADDPEPKYGLAVTGLADPDRLLRLDRGRAGVPLTLTKPLGLGVLNARHKATGEVFGEAIAVMVQLNRDAAAAALVAGAVSATDVSGFGLLGSLHCLTAASGVSAIVDAAAIPYLEGARAALAAGYISAGTRHNLAWVRPTLDSGRWRDSELLLLADAQTSGGLLVAGELPGHPVIGELAPPRPDGVTITVV